MRNRGSYVTGAEPQGSSEQIAPTATQKTRTRGRRWATTFPGLPAHYTRAKNYPLRRPDEGSAPQKQANEKKKQVTFEEVPQSKAEKIDTTESESNIGIKGATNKIDIVASPDEEISALYVPPKEILPSVTIEVTPKDSPIEPRPKGKNETRFYMKIRLNGQVINALVDGGSQKSYLGHKATEHVRHHVKPQKISYRCANGTIDESYGVVPVDMTVDGLEKELQFRIVSTFDYDCILGKDFLKKFEIIEDHLRGHWIGASGNAYKFSDKPERPSVTGEEFKVAGLQELEDSQQGQLEQLLTKLWDEKPVKIFDLAKYKIDVGGHEPIKQRQRRYSPKMIEIAQQQVDSYLEQGFIKPSSSPWCSPFVISTRANGEPRFCIDFRKVNAVTKKDAYMIPHMDSILDQFRVAKFVTTIDLRNAYHHIPLDEPSKELTAFYVPGRGLLHFEVLPFGLTNAGAGFQRTIDQVILPEWRNVFAYLDDIIIASETFEEHLECIGKVVNRIHQFGLTINREKSHFCRKEVNYLGYVLSSKGLKIDPEKIRPILEYPAPKNLKQLRRFLGMAGWYSRFIDNFSEKKVPLTKLLSKNCPWNWEPEQQAAFEWIKQAIVTAPVLIRPDFSLPFQVHSDASNFAVGAVLTQMRDGYEHPICFASRTLSKAERNYSVTEKECLGVIFAIEKMRPYVQGYHFTIVTDHASLKWLHNLKDPCGRLARWATKLQAYDYDIVHRRGADHKVPDALSRAFEEQVQQIIEDHVSAAEELKEDITDWYELRKRLIKANPRKFPDWHLEGDLLYVHRPNSWVDPIIEDLESWKIVLPKKLRERAMHDAHDVHRAGHMGIDKTYHRLQQYYYWPGMYKDVAEYVNTCLDCQLVKIPRTSPPGEMGYRCVEGPWTNVTTDVMGPFPASYNQKKYIVMFVDNFTKYVELKAITEANSTEILKAFEELVVSKWGCPLILTYDNGSEYVNKPVTDRLETYGIRPNRTPIYHPQANPTERSNQTIKTMIRTFISGDQRNWDLHLHEFAFAVNTAVHSSTKYSPAFLNFGRNPLPPHCVRNHLPLPLKGKPLSKDVWVDRVKRLSAIHDLVRAQLDLAFAKQAKYYDKHRKKLVYNVGDRVLRRTHYLSKGEKFFSTKLADPFKGPCLVEKKISDVVYEVLDITDDTRHKLHVSDLKPLSEINDLSVQDGTTGPEPEAQEPTPESRTSLQPPPRKTFDNCPQIPRQKRGRPRRDAGQAGTDKRARKVQTPKEIPPTGSPDPKNHYVNPGSPPPETEKVKSPERKRGRPRKIRTTRDGQEIGPNPTNKGPAFDTKFPRDGSAESNPQGPGRPENRAVPPAAVAGRVTRSRLRLGQLASAN